MKYDEYIKILQDLKEREAQYFQSEMETNEIPKFIDFQELKTIVDFKLKFGTFRPGFWSRIEKNNSSDHLKCASIKAFEQSLPIEEQK